MERRPAAPGLPSASLQELLGDAEQGVETGVGPGQGVDPGGDFAGASGVQRFRRGDVEKPLAAARSDLGEARLGTKRLPGQREAVNT